MCEVPQVSVIKIQNKIANFLETHTLFSEKRTQFIKLNKEYRGLSRSKKPQDTQTTVEKVLTDANGVEVKVSQVVKKRTFPNVEVETLYTDLKKKRKEILRFHKQATLYINLLCERVIQDFISSCESISTNKKSQEKTFGWKQFNKQKFSQSFTCSLVQGSKYFNDFVAVKHLINQFAYDKEVQRLKQGYTKADSTTVQQDLQRYKFLKTKQEDVTPAEIDKQIEEEFGTVWGGHLGNIYQMLEHLQSDDENSKFLFNNVKNVTRTYQESQRQQKTTDQSDTVETTEEVKKVKISNGFKNMISKILREMLMGLSFKIQLYLESQSNHQIKLQDIKKIVKVASTLDDLDVLKTQFTEFDNMVQNKINEIETLKQQTKLTNSTQKSETTTTEPASTTTN